MGWGYLNSMVIPSINSLTRVYDNLTAAGKSGIVRSLEGSVTAVPLSTDETALGFRFLAVGGISNVHDFFRALQLLQGSPLTSITHKCLCLRPK